MVHLPAFTRRSFTLLTAAFLGVGGVLSASPALAAPDHGTVVSTVPSSASPNITNGTVFAIHDAGSKIVTGGSFTQVQDRGSATNLTRDYVLAFNEATGKVDPAFAPVVDGQVSAIAAGPTAGTVYIAGQFNNVNGQTRRKVALLNLADGSLVTTFKPPAFDGLINDIVKVGDRLLVGGIFTTANTGVDRGGLASLNASTGAVDGYLTTDLTVNHNYTPGSTGAQAGVGAQKLALSPDGSELVVIGNFKNANGVLHDQIVRLNLGATTATVSDWNTDRYGPACAAKAFDSYVRDVTWSPDGTYFVVVTTGAMFAGTLCDAAARWNASGDGPGQQPAWVQYSGGDTFLSVGISEKAVYVGGHLRWVNNSLGKDAAQAGAVARPSIAALDPANGLPLSWNPGRHPRGYGVTEMLVTPQGIWMGHDQTHFGNFEYRRERIGFFPLAGGDAPHSTATGTLPGKVYQAGATPIVAAADVLHRVNAGGPAVPATDGGPAWAADTLAAPSPFHNTGGSVTAYTTTATVDATVPGTTPVSVFNDERWDGSAAPEMQWDLPVAAGTRMQVRLYLANRYAGTAAVGKRIFDVSIDGAVKLDNFDAIAQVGHDKGTMRAFTVVSDGIVDIDFGHVVENPLVQAVEIVRIAPPPPAANVLHRVNAGGPELAALDGGPVWSADTATEPSSFHNPENGTFAYATNAALDPTVPASTPTAVFNDERWDAPEVPAMQWDLPVAAGTQVQVRLYLANRWAGTAAVGKRVFDVSIDGAVRLDNFDPIVATGHNRGTLRAFTITSDGNVDIDFGHVVENPLVQAIEIVQIPAPPAGSNPDSVQVRTYDGASTAGDLAALAGSTSTTWSAAKGAFWVGGTLFYGMDGALWRRTFNGTTFGTPALVNPYQSAKWDVVVTGSLPEGQTYRGATTNFYAEIPNVTGMFYSAGRVYYTLSGQSGLYWRWFTPDSGVVGADRFTVAGATGFANAGGIFVSGDTLYVVGRSTGDLSSVDWSAGVPTGTPTVVSGPSTDDQDWRGTAVFVGP